MKLISSSKLPRPVCFCLVLSLIMLLVPAVLIPFWVNRVKRIEGEIKVYTSSANVEDVLQRHFHNNMKFGFMLIILMMSALAVSIIIFVILTIRAARREMHLCSSFLHANHDLRASLASISGLIELSRRCAQDFAGSELLNYLNLMESCTNDLLALLNSILDQSKLVQGKKQLKEEEFDMEELLEHVVNFHYPNGAMKNVDVILDPCDGSIARFSRVKGDRGELRRILINLLHNAVKFTSEGHITLRAWARKPNKVQKDPNCVEFIFEVDDTGKGIPKEKKKSVFVNYVQVNDQSTSAHGSSQKGTGLGLGITQTLVRLMGGEVSIVDKDIGVKGTCFRFNIFMIGCDQPQDQDQEHQAISVDYVAEEDMESNVILFIKEEERSRVLRTFMMNIIGLKVYIANQHEQFSQTLKKVKKKLPLSGLRGIGIDDHIDISSFQRRNSRLSSKSSLIRFILIIIDSSFGLTREISRAMADFRKDFPKNVSLRVVWLDKPGLDEDKLPSTDIVMAKPLHGSVLYRALEFVPEFRDKMLSTSRMKIQQPSMSIKSPTLDVKRDDVSVDVNGNLPLTGKKILVVEDNMVLLVISSKMVSQLGGTTYTCKNGKEALDNVREILKDQREIGPSTPTPPYDYILMDCKMPEMDGFEATKCIREEEAPFGIRIPIIALTAHTGEVTDKIFQVGMDYYIQKPIDVAKLLEAIDYIEHAKLLL